MDPVTVCPFCHVAFTLEDLMSGPDIVPIGMMLNDDEAAWNFYYFNHMAENCGTTFTVRRTADSCRPCSRAECRRAARRGRSRE